MAESSNNCSNNLAFEVSFQIEKDFITKYNALNYILRNLSFVNHHEKIITIPSNKLRLVTSNTEIPFEVVERIVRGFLINLLLFRDHIKEYKLSWGYRLKIQIGKVSTYLGRLFDLAPVFDLDRAKKNLEILYKLFELHCYWPCLTTQLALVIFVTDRNDQNNSEFIIQKNLRAICANSAYAFHRARNKLGIDKNGKLK